MIVGLIDKAVESGARLKQAAAIVGLSARTIIRWRHRGGGKDQRTGPLTTPANKLSDTERQQIIEVSNSPDGHFKIPHLWPGQNPPPEMRFSHLSGRAK